jgi:hypothetical protein
MTDQEINRAVAESVGWTQIRECEDSFFQGLLVGVRGDGAGMAVPDFANSYEAIMPLVKTLKKGRENRFAQKLYSLIYPDFGTDWEILHVSGCHDLITATPRQLCEAYLAVGGANA